MAHGAPGHLGIIHLGPRVFIKIAWSYNNLGKQQLELCSTQGNRRSTGNTNECHDLRPVWLSSHLLFLSFEFFADLQDYFPLQINPRSPALPIAFASQVRVPGSTPRLPLLAPRLATGRAAQRTALGVGTLHQLRRDRPPVRPPHPLHALTVSSLCADLFVALKSCFPSPLPRPPSPAP